MILIPEIVFPLLPVLILFILKLNVPVSLTSVIVKVLRASTITPLFSELAVISDANVLTASPVNCTKLRGSPLEPLMVTFFPLIISVSYTHLTLPTKRIV